MNIEIEALKFNDRGLIPAIVQDATTRRVLMLAYMNAESLKRTIESGETWFWSRSRSSLWHKGETSGNTQRVVNVSVDCDADTLLVLVEARGPACHTGAVSCFRETLPENLDHTLDELYSVVTARRLEKPEGSYTAYLFDQGLDKVLKKVGEEAAETIIAAKNDDLNALSREAADLLYHLVVLFVERGLTLAEVREELLRRKRGQT
jgi:phosphoribosyl-ATP pyrophosphohydrolase/phosphoribosyl-AMP cyclohydrolase